MKIGDKVKYSSKFLQSLGSTFTEEEFKEFNKTGTVIRLGKTLNTNTFVCVVDFDGEEKKILNKNLAVQ